MNRLLRRNIHGTFMVFVGFLLSPLSWWNDIVVNIPLAYLFAIPFSLITSSLFMPMMIIGYLGTNILGFIMMHHGSRKLLKKESNKNFKKEMIKMLIISTLYTILILILIITGILKLPWEYFNKHG